MEPTSNVVTIPIGAGRGAPQARLATIMSAHLQVERWARRRHWFSRAAIGTSIPMACLLYAGRPPGEPAVHVVLWLWLAAMILTTFCAEATARADERLDRLLAR